MLRLFKRKRVNRTFNDNVQSADIGSRTMHGSITAVSAQGIRLGLQLLGTMVLARLLSPEDFGLVAMSAVVVSFAQLFADFGLASATIQRKELDNNTVSALFYIQIGIALGLMLVIMAASPLIALAFDDARVKLLVIVLAPTLPILTASSMHIALLQREMRWYKMQGVGIIAQLVGIVIAITVSLTTDIGYWALVVQSWTAALTTCLLAWTWSQWVPGRVSNWSQAMPAVKFGLGLTSYNIINSWHRQFDNMVIGAMAGAEQLGYYSRAYGLMMIPMNAVVRPFNTAVFPAMSRLQSDLARWRQMFLSSVATVTCLTSFIAGLLILMADTIVPLLFGEQWYTSVPIFKILAISMMIQPIYNAAGLLSFSIGETQRMLKASYFSTVVYTVAFLVGGWWQGAIGVAIAYTISVYLIAPFWVWWAARGTNLNVSRISLAVAPPMVAALGAFTAVIAMPFPDSSPLSQSLRGIMFCGLYVVFLIAQWLVFKEWRNDVRPVMYRALSFVGSLRTR